MRLSHIVAIGMLALWLCSCGRPDTPGLSSAAPTPTPRTPGPGVVELLRQLPAAGASVEVDAYATRLGDIAPSMPPSAGWMGACPVWIKTLTDRPFPGTVPILDTIGTNSLPDDAPWLSAVFDKDLPYHARLRGHFGDPAFAGCHRAERIFVVEQVVTVYEQTPPDPEAYDWRRVPKNYASWPRYSDMQLGYSLPYPPNWQVTPMQVPDTIAALAIRTPQSSDMPIVVHVYEGETHADPYDPMSVPSRLNGEHRVFEQDRLFQFSEQRIETQHLAGYRVDRGNDPNRPQVTVIFSGHGRTYELALQYTAGIDTPLPLLLGYAGIVAGFRFDTLPAPSPTPPIKQTLGPGPFLNQDQALAQVREQNMALGEMTLVDARLVTEAEARTLQWECPPFQGHPDGVWLLTVRATLDGSPQTYFFSLNATTGKQLCGQGTSNAPTTPRPTPLPGTVEATAVPVTPGAYPAP